MAVTKKGRLWEFRKSLWILWSLIFFLNGVGMFLAGKKVKVRKWYSFGLIYTAVSWACMIFGTEAPNAVQNVIYTVFFLSYLACIVHCFIIKKEYLVRLELLEDTKAEHHEIEVLRNQAAKEYGFNNNVNINDQHTVPQVPPKPEPVKKYEEPEANRLNINTCSELELSELPGVGLIMAKKAISLRNNKNGFASVDEFIQEVGIKPHFVERLKTMICCIPLRTAETIKSSGRMVDF